MMAKVTNEDIIKEIRNQKDEITERLDKLNGQVAKNTLFREKHTWAYKIFAGLGAIVVGAIGIWKGIWN